MLNNQDAMYSVLLAGCSLHCWPSIDGWPRYNNQGQGRVGTEQGEARHYILNLQGGRDPVRGSQAAAKKKNPTLLAAEQLQQTANSHGALQQPRCRPDREAVRSQHGTSKGLWQL